MDSEGYDKYLHKTKWKKKRLKILRRDKFRCTVCGTKDALVIHHAYYFKKFVPPWDYPNRALLTLCENCHYEYHIHHEIEYKENQIIKKNVKKKKIRNSDYSKPNEPKRSQHRIQGGRSASRIHDLPRHTD